MPLITYDSPVARISGRLGSAPNTYTFNNGAPVIRFQPTVPNPDSTDQQAIRAIFSAVTKRWPLITQAQRNAWQAFAQANVITNRLGNPVGRNGISAFVELNTGHMIDTGAILDAAPVLARPSAPSAVTIPSAQSSGTELGIEVAHGYTTLTGLFLVVRATPDIVFESQTPKLTDYRLVKGVNTNSILPLTASGLRYDFAATKYSYTDNNFVGVEVTIMNAEGWQSPVARVFGLYQV